ncbi:hypothetical protein [Crenothrix polyspora]|uniref:Uncharacterized protein n=1 Tax=Crenothrix polyspora TaxID=360316 RepID=A0A1R4H482_9GAMM|nr:hypothetical protein [Crenothrix polyspora]SJM91078.1 hypothetical protein CRENPOLYSF1_1700009 [Crenothrix polyspora]
MSENTSTHLIAYICEVRGDGMDARITEQYTTELPLLNLVLSHSLNVE